MRHILMATVALSLAGSALAQSTAPVYQNNQSEAQRKAGGNQANAELFFMIEQLQGEVRRLQGELEEQRYQLNRLSKQSKERYIDLDQRLLDVSKELHAAPKPSDGSVGSKGVTTPATVESRQYRQPSEEERQAYQRIQALIQEDKNYDAAIDGLYAFISEYPEGDLTVNAYYWLGEVYLVKPQLEQAKQAFTIVATRFSDHRKAADAVYKLGLTYDRMKDVTEAKKRMRAVVSDYPGTQAATLAERYLNSN
ncbi:tol-pal system protein YbgF [Marinobacter caseinilyticus]|uniref:tol-pal system protein YbgF n=1 Tax=Marinobacter caseinilyticus TaxID=2692195 RepID=UPI00140A9DED|nr:tol-pal system protein YbgF [Marinobacter caseinilyticus]